MLKSRQKKQLTTENQALRDYAIMTEDLSSSRRLRWCASASRYPDCSVDVPVHPRRRRWQEVVARMITCAKRRNQPS
jgi:hypothetical protein